jgi:hypothetical protein
MKDAAIAATYLQTVLPTDDNYVQMLTNRATFQLGTASGNVYFTGTVMVGTASPPSDARVKKNITSLDVDDSFNKVLSLDPKSYEMKDPDIVGTQFGLIAQDLQSVLPACVHTSTGEFYFDEPVTITLEDLEDQIIDNSTLIGLMNDSSRLSSSEIIIRNASGRHNVRFERTDVASQQSKLRVLTNGSLPGPWSVIGWIQGGFLSVNYTMLIPHLINCIQKLAVENEELRTRVTALEA